MEDFLINAFQGIVGSSPVAAVLVWRLIKADRSILRLEERVNELTDDHTKFMKRLAGIDGEEV